ncbi:hypothetical protein Tco_0134691 [Tanacetum coccineum]
MAWGLLDRDDKSDSKIVDKSETYDEDGEDDIEIVSKSPDHDFCLWRDDDIDDDIEVVCPTRYGFGLVKNMENLTNKHTQIQ